MTDLVDRLREIAAYFMENGVFPQDYSPFIGIRAEVYPIPTVNEILEGEATDPIEVRFSGYTQEQTFVTARPWTEFKKRPQRAS